MTRKNLFHFGNLFLALFLVRHDIRADEGRAIYKKTLRGTALVQVRFKNGAAGQATCFVVDKERKILVTNHHVVANASTIRVLFPAYADDKAFRGGRPLSARSDYLKKTAIGAKLLDTDAQRDLALLQVDSLPEGTTELKLAAESASPGDRIHSIGNPGASEGMWIYAEGSARQVYQRHWRVAFMVFDAWVLETQTPTNPGDSGGPIVNDVGEAVAVTSSIIETFQGKPVQAINYGIDVREIRSFLDQTVKLLKPQTAADYALRGERLLLRERTAEAKEDFVAALKIDGKCAAAHRNLGKVLRLKGEFRQARESLDKAIELDGKDGEAYFQRGLAHWQEGKPSWDKAVADFSYAIRLMPAPASAYNQRGVAYLLQGKMDLALADYNLAIEKDPNLAVAYINRGDIFRLRRDLKKAQAEYVASYRILPTLLGGQRVGEVLLDLKEPKEAVTWASSIIPAFERQNAPLYRVLALGHEQLADYLAALKDYNAAILRDSKSAWTYFQRGQLYERLSDFRASADYEKAVQLDARLADKVKIQNLRYIDLRNNTSENLEVHLFYETLTEQKEWYWYPETPPSGRELRFSVEAGKTVQVHNGDFRVHARRIRIWAEGQRTGALYGPKDKDVWTCEKEYRSQKRMAALYVFAPQAPK